MRLNIYVKKKYFQMKKTPGHKDNIALELRSEISSIRPNHLNQPNTPTDSPAFIVYVEF